MVPGQEAKGDNLEKCFDLLIKNGMLSVCLLIRITSGDCNEYTQRASL